MKTSDVIAITGATGRIGGMVANRLVAAGREFRPLTRADASYGDVVTMTRALAGVDRLLLVSGRESATRLQEHTSAVDAAMFAGVRHIVYLSFLGASPTCTFTLGRQHHWTEEHIREQGMAHTFLRDSLYLDMFHHVVGSDGVIRGPAGDGRFAAVAHEDVADVATAVLLDPDAHAGQAYDVTGPESISFAEGAAVLTEVLGRPVTYHAESEEEAYASRAHYGAPDFEVEGWVTSYQAVAAGELDVVSDAVDRVAGHKPMGLRDYLALHPKG